jgi:hypothetical protein
MGRDNCDMKLSLAEVVKILVNFAFAHDINQASARAGTHHRPAHRVAVSIIPLRSPMTGK